MRLTEAQRNALRVLKKDGQRSAYPGLKMATLQALQKRGLVKAYRGQLGAMAFPRSRVLWSITDSGRAAIFQIHDADCGGMPFGGQSL